ncbi:hypothetical protein [Psychrobacter frigidicola]|uniref:hypothetical protein n=1 Tax=Psychrobacter frigidicola TaxID=45611 RepID=UPI0019180CF9|nr:hypothetical protein [Psychrobacter frigidicola]
MLQLFVKSLISAGAIISLMLTTGAQASANNSHSVHPTEQPIRFAKGQVSTSISGKLSPKQHERWYQFSAASGQYTVINITPLSGTPETANVGVLHMPNGSQDGTKGGIIYQGCLPVSGNYRLRIARNLMATHDKTAGYTVEVIILPKYASRSLCE